LTKAYVIHESDVHFDVEFHIDGYLEKDGPVRTPTKRAELYVSEGNIYIGRDDKWYRIGIKEIRDIMSVNQQKKLELVFDKFRVSLFTDNYSHLNALRDILCIVQAKMAETSKKKKVRRGVAN
jgi:hypothetical protein